MMAAILPLLYVERGDQMVFVIQSIILLFSGVYYSVDHPSRVDAVRRRSSRRARTCSRGSAAA